MSVLKYVHFRAKSHYDVILFYLFISNSIGLHVQT